MEQIQTSFKPVVIKVFGEQAERLEDGDVLQVTIRSVEGRKVAILHREGCCDDCGYPLKAYSRDDMDVEYTCVPCDEKFFGGKYK